MEIYYGMAKPVMEIRYEIVKPIMDFRYGISQDNFLTMQYRYGFPLWNRQIRYGNPLWNSKIRYEFPLWFAKLGVLGGFSLTRGHCITQCVSCNVEKSCYEHFSEGFPNAIRYDSSR